MLVLENLSKTYRTRIHRVKALEDVSLRIEKGEFVVVCGPSGSGKTTLLMMIAAMLHPSRGCVRFGEKDIYGMTGPERAKFRANNIGFVFQMFHLVPYLSVVENVLVAGGAVGNHDGARAKELLQQLGLQHRLRHRPAELSAGEKQRAAIARALLNRPKLILADEPTGNLDPENAAGVLKHLRDFQQAGGTVIMATHGPAAGDVATRTIHLREGVLADPA
ncbi:MAG: ABC transporter ATP-binding protein [Sedimentisphaerales bacterium]|nr:ABC transporter ATP-binding protein [Sedimentisphaerales bacterium]